jgi:hypothetical protein
MTLYDTYISDTVTCDVCSKEHPRTVICSLCGREKLADPHGTLGWPSNAQLIDGDYEGLRQWTCQDREACEDAYAARMVEERQLSKPRVMLQLIHSARAALKGDYGPEYAAEALDELDEFIKIGKVPWESEVE